MRRPKHFYYVTHQDNLPSILKHGILSHSRIESEKIQTVRIYDDEIVSKRKEKILPSGDSLWSYANFYFQARNPMLYRVTREKDAKKIVVLQVNPDIINSQGALISDGNAANQRTQFYPADQGLPKLKEEVFKRQYWDENDDSKRMIMAEILVPSHIAPDKIMSIFTADEETRKRVSCGQISIIPQPNIFFRPEYQHRLSHTIFLAKGDMFFSTAQTLAVSVNTVGIMGKGVASRAKYQFPDVYVYYQDACRRNTLKIGKPVLYKRAGDFEKTLSDESESLHSTNGERWFLLFPTKNHWRNNSSLDEIEKGLKWLVKNCQKEEIKSIAMPALGCGLGGLNWKEIGPLMCKYLSQLPIEKSIIYLPAEHQTPLEYLQPEFLMPQG